MEATANRHSMRSSNDRRGQGPPSPGDLLYAIRNAMSPRHQIQGFAIPVKVGQIEAGTERLALARYHDGAQIRLRLQIVNRVDDGLEHSGI